MKHDSASKRWYPTGQVAGERRFCQSRKAPIDVQLICQATHHTGDDKQMVSLRFDSRHAKAIGVAENDVVTTESPHTAAREAADTMTGDSSGKRKARDPEMGTSPKAPRLLNFSILSSHSVSGTINSPAGAKQPVTARSHSSHQAATPWIATHRTAAPQTMSEKGRQSGEGAPAGAHFDITDFTSYNWGPLHRDLTGRSLPRDGASLSAHDDFTMLDWGAILHHLTRRPLDDAASGSQAPRSADSAGTHYSATSRRQ